MEVRLDMADVQIFINDRVLFEGLVAEGVMARAAYYLVAALANEEYGWYHFEEKWPAGSSTWCAAVKTIDALANHPDQPVWRDWCGIEEVAEEESEMSF